MPRPQRARIFWTLAGIFVLLGALFGLAFWGLRGQTHRMANDACLDQGGTWDSARGLCVHNR